LPAAVKMSSASRCAASGYGYEGGDQGLLSFTRGQLLTG
jgi:hypothetical protein